MSNRVAFVTGSSRGIGRAIALTLSREGFYIVVASPEVENNELVAGEIRAAGGEAMTLNMDIGSQESVKEGFGQVLAAKGRVDVLVNNAGITRDGLAMRMKPADWDLVLKINLTGAFFAAQQALPGMMKNRWAHRQHGIGGGSGRQPWAGELRRLQGGSDRSDQGAGAGNGQPRHHGQRGRAGLY